MEFIALPAFFNLHPFVSSIAIAIVLGVFVVMAPFIYSGYQQQKKIMKENEGKIDELRKEIIYGITNNSLSEEEIAQKEKEIERLLFETYDKEIAESMMSALSVDKKAAAQAAQKTAESAKLRLFHRL